MLRLDVRNLSVTVGGDYLLDDVSFQLDRGERLIIIGPNGAGKTVLLKALVGLMPYTGEVTWAPDVRIGYVPQKIDADRHLPVTYRDLFISKCHVAGESTTRIGEVVQDIRMADNVLDTPVGRLSGGQFQLGLVGFALLSRPNVLILDEPTASIDQPGEEHIYSVIDRLQQEYELSMIVVTHDMSFVYRGATSVMCLNRRNICYGAPETLTPEVLAKLYGESQLLYRHDHFKVADLDLKR